MADRLETSGAFWTVRGRVQGVGFRYSAQREARRLRLEGWVRNAEDGSVELLAEGSRDALEAMDAWLRRGPPGAMVSSVARTDRQATAIYRGFGIEY